MGVLRRVRGKLAVALMKNSGDRGTESRGQSRFGQGPCSGRRKNRGGIEGVAIGRHSIIFRIF
jgi:hypothetical protein